jgi:signal transduction histidine kinase/CheY-like chemotaxis protein
LRKLLLSIRLKVLLVINGIILSITAASLFPSLWFAQIRFTETIESDMSVSGVIAATLVSREIELVRKDVEFAAMKILRAREQGFSEAALDAVLRAAREQGFRSFSVIEVSGEIATFGETLFPPGAYDHEDARRAFRGEALVSSSEYDMNGDLVFRIWVPLAGNRVVCAVVPGLSLSERVAQFRIWKTGSIFVLDKEGTVIADPRPDIVWRRKNYTGDDGKDPAYRGLGELHRRMLRGDSGIGYYHFEGGERLCAYTAIPGSDGWVLGVVAPSGESPLADIRWMLLISHGIFLNLGIIAAFLTANNIAALFYRIEDQNHRLEELMRTAESASEAKSRFLANMSHEMRTPLNAVVGLSELALGSETLTEGAYESMEKIYTSGMNLLGIINDILDISKIEAGKFDLIPVEYDLPSLINDTVNLNIVRIGSKRIEFRLHVEETLPARLLGDELRLKQIFNNLLSNAFKYTPEGSVDWYLSGERKGEEFWLSARFEDTGIGIKEEDLEKLFVDYSQVDPRSHRLTEGTGLGLSITKRLAELMGGSITVQSEYHRGSVFTVRVKQDAVNDEAIGPETAGNLASFRYTVQRRSRNEKFIRAHMPYASVLVVDDVQINLDVARGMFKPYGMAVDCVDSGQKAIDLIRGEKVRYSAVFMDHMMPDMDGIEAVRIIRNEIGTEYARTVPIIALTANAIVGTDDLFLSNGFQAFLSKPIDVIRLDGVLNHWVRNKELEKQAPPVPASPPAASAGGAPGLRGKTLEGLDIPQGLRLFGGDEDAYLQVLRSYAAHLPALLDSLGDPAAAEALESYRVKVHGIKGSSYSICADPVGKMAEGLEKAARSGDLGYVRERNGGFISAARALLRGLEALLAGAAPSPEAKPEKSEPDRKLLARALEASEKYDIEKLEEALAALEAYRYASGGELVGWLRERASRSEFGMIVKRLTEEQNRGK